MSLPQAYNKRMMTALSARAVWFPGDTLTAGKVVQRTAKGVFTEIAKLADFGIDFTTTTYRDNALNLKSSGSSVRILQGGVEVKQPQIDLQAQASVEINFTKKYEFLMKTPTLRGTGLEGLAQIGRALAGAPGWNHDEHFLVYKSYEATEFAFLGTLTTNSKVEFSGKGAGIISFLTAGLTGSLSKSGSAEVDIVGKGGPVAMGLVRVEKNGSLDFSL
jgi:hypothetical protein